MAKGNDNAIDIDSFDEIYLKNIDPAACFATSPAQRKYFFTGFNQAIDLFHKYLAEEKISFEEAEDRARIIMEVLLDDSHSKTFGQRKS